MGLLSPGVFLQVLQFPGCLFRPEGEPGCGHGEGVVDLSALRAPIFTVLEPQRLGFSNFLRNLLSGRLWTGVWVKGSESV